MPWLAFVSLFMGASLWAQQSPNDSIRIQELEEVVVSDTRFPIKRENSGKTVIRIGPEELKRNAGKSLPQLINTKSGIEISGSRGRPGEVLGVFVRGGRGRQVVVMVDGIRVSDPSSFSQEFDLRLLPITSIASVEIIKGASSTLYGANAATAVINITTKDPSLKKLQGNFQAIMGSNQTASEQRYRLNSFSNSALVNGSLNRWTYAVGFNNRFTEGLSSLITPDNEEDPFSAIYTDIKIGYRFNKLKVQLTANQSKLRSAYDESYGFLDAPYVFESQQDRVGLSSVLPYASGSITLNAAYARYTSENISAFPGTFEGRNFIGDLFNKYTMKHIALITGVNYSHEQSEFDTSEQFTSIDPYASMTYLHPDGVQLNVGSRLNNHSEYGSQWVYTVNPSYVLKREKGYLKFFGSYATAFITPSLTQLFGQFGANPELKPETNRTIEVGMEYAITSKMRASMVYFGRREENFVFFDNLSFLYGNAADATRAAGVELEISYTPLKDLSLQANYTFTERKGDNAIRIPKHKLNATAGVQVSDAFYASLTYAYTGRRMDTDFNTFTDVSLESFSLAGAYFSYDLLQRRLKVFLRGENLLNKEFTEVFGFTTPGRNLQMGFNLQF